MRAICRHAADSVTLRARHVVSETGQSRIAAWVRVERGRIAAVGFGRPGGAVVDLEDAIILPGLVNAHTHLEFSDLDQPLSADGGLPAWIERVVAERRSHVGMAGECRRAAAVAAGLEQSCRLGVTAIGEIATAMPPHPRGDGPRVRVFRETLGLSHSAMATARAELVRDVDRMVRRGVEAGISPHAPYSVGWPLGRDAVADAVRRGLPVAMHLGESREELELVATAAGSLRRTLERLGAWRAESPPSFVPMERWISLLARSRRGIVVHGTYLPEVPVAMARLARHRDRLCVVVCPRTTRALAGRLPPVGDFLAAGVRVAIGTDSRASNPDLSVLAEASALVAAGAVGPRAAIEMITGHAAWALGFERSCGRILVGRPADLVVLRPAGSWRDPFDAALDPSTRPVATFRGGRCVVGADVVGVSRT